MADAAIWFAQQSFHQHSPRGAAPQPPRYVALSDTWDGGRWRHWARDTRTGALVETDEVGIPLRA